MPRASRVFRFPGLSLPGTIAALALALACAAPAQSPPDLAGTGTASGPSSGALALGEQDYYWASASALAGIAAQIRYYGMPATDTAALDKNRDLWPIDRWTAGMNSDRTALASNALIFPLIALPMAATAWDSRQGLQTWGAAFSDAVVYGEALALSSSLNLMVRSLRVHPRPFVYDARLPAQDRLAGEASGSFYSGHANAAFLSAVYFSYTYSLRHPDAPGQGLIWAGTLGAATLEAGLRVASGRHYLSDVLAGAAMGSAFGWAFPYWHRREAGTGRTGLGMGCNQAGPYPVLTWKF